MGLESVAKWALRYEIEIDMGIGAEEGIRTLDPLLGKEVLYH